MSLIYAQQPSRILAKNKEGVSYSERQCAEKCGCVLPEKEDRNTYAECASKVAEAGPCSNGILTTVATCYLQCINQPDCLNKEIGDTCATEKGEKGNCRLGRLIALNPSGYLVCDPLKTSTETEDCQAVENHIINTHQDDTRCQNTLPLFCQENVDYPAMSCDPECNEEGYKEVENEEGDEGYCGILKDGQEQKVSGALISFRRFFCYGTTKPENTEECVPPYGIYIRDYFDCLEGRTIYFGEHSYTLGNTDEWKQDSFTAEEEVIKIDKGTCEYLQSCMNIEGIEIKWIAPEKVLESCIYKEGCTGEEDRKTCYVCKKDKLLYPIDVHRSQDCSELGVVKNQEDKWGSESPECPVGFFCKLFGWGCP